MSVEVNVVGDLREMRRDLQRIKAAIPTITSRAVNELAVWARAEAVTQVAKDIGQKENVVGKTILRGRKVDRFKLTRATRQLAVAYLRVDTGGIQFTDIAMAAIGPWNVPGRKHKKRGGGVKLRGGRFQKGAFKGRAKGAGVQRVWMATDRPSSVNPGKMKLTLPRIGIRQRIAAVFQSRITGAKGATVFRQRFERLARLELAKAGIR